MRYEWGRVPEGARDITVKLYSKMDLALVDEHNRTNQYSMDTLEAFDGIVDDFWNQHVYRPHSLVNLILHSESTGGFAEAVHQYPWVLWRWLNEY